MMQRADRDAILSNQLQNEKSNDLCVARRINEGVMHKRR